MSDPVRILVCGSRTFSHPVVVASELAFVSTYYNGNIMIIHGAAPGADTLADEWAKAVGKEIEAYPADWKRYGKRAGFLRNTQMLEEGRPDRVVAFVDKPLAESKGTKMMVDIACTGGVPCLVVEHNRYVLHPTNERNT